MSKQHAERVFKAVNIETLKRQQRRSATRLIVVDEGREFRLMDSRWEHLAFLTALFQSPRIQEQTPLEPLEPGQKGRRE